MGSTQPLWIPFAAGAVGAVLGAACAIVAGEIREFWQRGRVREGHLEALLAEIRICGAIAAGYVPSRVTSPAYRMPLIGHQRSLAQVFAERLLTQADSEALMRFYVNAEAFNRCLDYCHEAACQLDDAVDAESKARATKKLMRQVNRAGLKARKLCPGTAGGNTHYDNALAVLGKHLPRASLDRLTFDAAEPESPQGDDKKGFIE